MSMWSPQPPPHPQSLGPRAVGRCCCCCCCFPACQGLASSLPAPPSPSQGCGDSSRGLEKAKLPKLQSPPVPSARLGVLTPRLVCHLSQRATPRPSAHGPPRAFGRQSQWPSLTWPTWACQPGVACLACQYLLPPRVPSSGPTGLPPLPPGSVPPSPAGPPQTQPGQLWDQACTAGADPCASPPCPSLVRPWAGPHRNLSLLLLF